MNPRSLKNNSELLEYLFQLKQHLEVNQYTALAEEINQATLFANGSATEFLHETQLALEHLTKERPRNFSKEQLKDAEFVILQIKSAFQKIGGA
jgi:hypothetical protein